MTYRVEFAKGAAKQFKALPPQVQQSLERQINRLVLEPRPRGVVKLSGESDIYRLRVGTYRVIYQIQDQQLLVLVVKVGHRREVYR